jgi:hypothetical protein
METDSMNDDARDSSASRGSGWVAIIIASSLVCAASFSLGANPNWKVPLFDPPPERELRREADREMRAQAIADAPMRQVEATRQLCDEIAALRREVAALRAAVDEMRKRK